MLQLCAPRRGTLPTCALSLDPGVSGYLVGQGKLVCLNSFCVLEMAAELCAAWGVEMAY